MQTKILFIYNSRFNNLSKAPKRKQIRKWKLKTFKKISNSLIFQLELKTLNKYMNGNFKILKTGSNR